jgi:hypothetical protein
MVWYSNNLLANQFFRFVYGAHVGCIDAQDTTGACDANHQTSGALLRQRLQQNLFFSRLCAGSFTITASRLSNTLGWQPIFTTGSGGELMHYQVTYTYQRFFVPQMLDDIFPGIFRLGHDMMIRNASFPATDGVGNPLGNYPLTTGC